MRFIRNWQRQTLLRWARSFGGPLFSATASGSACSAVTATGTTGAYGITATSDTGNAGRFGNASAPDATTTV